MKTRKIYLNYYDTCGYMKSALIHLKCVSFERLFLCSPPPHLSIPYIWLWHCVKRHILRNSRAIITTTRRDFRHPSATWSSSPSLRVILIVFNFSSQASPPPLFSLFCSILSFYGHNQICRERSESNQHDTVSINGLPCLAHCKVGGASPSFPAQARKWAKERGLQ